MNDKKTDDELKKVKKDSKKSDEEEKQFFLNELKSRNSIKKKFKEYKNKVDYEKNKELAKIDQESKFISNDICNLQKALCSDDLDEIKKALKDATK